MGAGGSVAKSACHHTRMCVTPGQGLLVRHPDYSERAPTNSDGNSHVGSAVMVGQWNANVTMQLWWQLFSQEQTRDEWSMHLMRCLFFFVAKFNLTLWAEHLPGRCNGAADALTEFLCCHRSPQHSKNQLQSQSNWPRSWCTNSQTGHTGAGQR